MPSLRARAFSLAIKALVRRRKWGDERALTRRARRLFGLKPQLQGLYAHGLRVARVSDGTVKGEWIRAKETRPGALLYFHGGGYVSCSPGTHRPVTTRLARLTQLPLFSLDYRLAPEHRFPAALDDAVAGYMWLVEKSGVDPKTIILAGDSAGGGLVLSTMVRLRDEGKPLPAGGVCFSPWTDLSGSSTTAHLNDGKCAMFRMDNIVDFANAYLGDTPPTHPLASSLFADVAGLPPILFQVGSTELLLDDSVRMHERIQLAGGESVLEIYEDLPHVWQMLDGFIPEARQSLNNVAKFVAKRLDRNSRR